MTNYKDMSEEQKERARAYARKYYRDHREERLRYAREDNPAHKAARLRKSRGKLRDLVYQRYGNACACCGESHPLFLSIDHVNGGGRGHRASLGAKAGTLSMLYDIKKRGFPPDFQILCFNCNCGRQRNGGVCPHKE